MDRRIVLVRPDGAAEPLGFEVAEGRWWSDNWITPRIQLRLHGLPGCAGIVLRGYAPAIAPRQIDNTLRVQAAGARLAHPLDWGRTFEIALPLDEPSAGDLLLSIEVQEGLAADLLDGRERGVILTRVEARPAG